MTSFYLFGEKVNQTELDRVNEFMKHHKKCGGNPVGLELLKKYGGIGK